MTTGQMIMKLREIKGELDAVWEPALFMGGPNLKHFTSAQSALCSLIESMLADDRRHAEARSAGNYQPCPRCGTKLYGMEVHNRGDCDNARAAKAHTMGELPYDGQSYPTKPQSQWTEEECKRVARLQTAQIVEQMMSPFIGKVKP